MRKLSIVLLFILGTFVIAQAQSGRKTKSAVTPGSVSTSTEQTQDESDYSESAPSKTSLIYTRQSAGDNNKKKSKNKKSETSPNSKTPSEPQTGNQNSDDEELVKIETNLVTIPVSVYERSGLYVSSLRRSDFKIFENGVEQEVAYFGTSEQPFTVILLIDTSPSAAYKIEEIQNAATAFVDQLKPGDSVMVIEFDASVKVLAEFTNDRQKVYKAIRRTGFGNGTSLYEAVDFSLRKRLNKIEGRKAIVLFTDGVDTTSISATFDKTLSAAVESEAVIFPIYYNTFLASRGIGQGGAMSTPPVLGLPTGGMQMPSSADYTRGRAYLEGLADLTGGRVFRPESTPGGLITAFEGIAEELRSQYNIGYYPKEEGTAGERKKIKVRVNRANVAVRARDSYIVGENEAPTKSTM